MSTDIVMGIGLVSWGVWFWIMGYLALKLLNNWSKQEQIITDKLTSGEWMPRAYRKSPVQKEAGDVQA